MPRGPAEFPSCTDTALRTATLRSSHPCRCWPTTQIRLAKNRTGRVSDPSATDRGAHRCRVARSSSYGRAVAVDAVARRMLDEHGGLNGLARAASRDVVVACGVGPAKSASLVAALEIGRRISTRVLAPGHAFAGPADVFHAYHARLRDLRHERFLAVLLDGRHRVMRDVLISQGTLTASLVHPREVFRPALREAAAAIVLVHNHPSGADSEREDREITRRLVAAGELFGACARSCHAERATARGGCRSTWRAKAFAAVRSMVPSSVPAGRATGSGSMASEDQRRARNQAGQDDARTDARNERRWWCASLFHGRYVFRVHDQHQRGGERLPVSAGTRVPVQFQLPGTDDPLKLDGRVVWASPPDGSAEGPGMGIEFENLGETARRRINDVVRTLRSDGGPKAAAGRANRGGRQRA